MTADLLRVDACEEDQFDSPRAFFKFQTIVNHLAAIAKKLGREVQQRNIFFGFNFKFAFIM